MSRNRNSSELTNPRFYFVSRENLRQLRLRVKSNKKKEKKVDFLIDANRLEKIVDFA